VSGLLGEGVVRPLDIELVTFGRSSMVSPHGAEYVLQPVAVDVRCVAAVAIRLGERALVSLLEVSVAVVDVEARQ
jgi:hypothetical protein